MECGAMKFIIKGRPLNVSMQEFRAICHATVSILEFHNIHPPKQEILVRFTSKDLGMTEKGGKCIGRANYEEFSMTLKNDLIYSTLLSATIHEIIHLYFHFNHSVTEKLTSTLTGKLRMDISQIGNILVQNIQRRAGYLAHLKISYLPKGEDGYDNIQYKAPYHLSKGVKFRRNLKKKDECESIG